MKSIKILPLNVHNSWGEFLNQDRLSQLEKIAHSIGDHFTPVEDKVLRFMTNDLKRLKIVILGQDPYPQEGRATGRAFEVGDLASWGDSFRQVSLKNIVRLIHKTSNNIERYDQIKSFSEIKALILKDEFKILRPNELFKSWEKQGVLLLNSYFTCEVGRPESHREIWADFSNDLMQYLVKQNPHLTWFLWGKEANSFRRLIINGKIYSSRHPMMCSEEFEDDFLKSPCFHDTRSDIQWLG